MITRCRTGEGEETGGAGESISATRTDRDRADEHDDWGMKVDPEKLNTLNCLNGHLSAEEDYYRDPRRRPRFTFYAVDEQLPPDAFNLERLMSTQDKPLYNFRFCGNLELAKLGLPWLGLANIL